MPGSEGHAGDVPAVPSPQDVQASCCGALVDEWRRGGLDRAVVCPGSRSTPLVLALVDGGFDVHVRLDERSAAFTALGMGLGSGRPAVLCTTSGTAAAEVHAAVVEAHHAGVPMLVCTADRPPELHGVGAPQTVEQRRIYGDAVRFSVDLTATDWEARTAWRSIGARLLAEATAAPTGPGPVHLNVACREPLIGHPSVVPPGRGDGAPWHRRSWPRPDASETFDPDDTAADAVDPSIDGVIVAGAGCGDPESVWALADVLGWPVLADPRSGCRADRPGVVAMADALLRDEIVASAFGPEVVVRLGAPWVSKVVEAFVERTVARRGSLVLVDPFGRWSDPGRVATRVVGAEPTWWCRSMASHHAERRRRDGRWRDSWAGAEAAARAAVARWSGSQTALTEPTLARTVVECLEGAATLVTAASMPMRDVEWFAPVGVEAPRVVANRGANGIDGVVSTALGVAATAGPTVALVGDLAFLHDLSALVRPAGFDPPCAVVVADNGGGGIFSFLPQAAALPPDRFERLFATPQAVDVAEVARGLAVPTVVVEDVVSLRDAVSAAVSAGALSVIVARLPDHQANVVAHGELHAAVADAVLRALGPR